MKQLRLPIFNSKIKYYNLRIVPPASVFNEVTAFKKQFENLYGKLPLSRSKPHITVATFKMNSKYEDFLIGFFDQLSRRETFNLNLNGFGIFESSKTLYLGVRKNEALKVLHRDAEFLYNDHLRRKLKLFKIMDNPHMTISKTTGKKMLYEGLQHFQKNKYSKQIEVSHLTLVSRSKYKTWDWEHLIHLS